LADVSRCVKGGYVIQRCPDEEDDPAYKKMPGMVNHPGIFIIAVIVCAAIYSTIYST
jgi:hypothetical protein